MKKPLGGGGAESAPLDWIGLNGMTKKPVYLH